MALHLQICDRAIAVDVERGRAEIASARESLGEAIARLRRQIFELRPTVLDEAGVAGTLRRYVSQLEQDGGPSLTLAGDLGAKRLTPDAEIGLYRVAQAAIANALRHADARTITVAIAADDGASILTVRDDGSGFDVSAAIAACQTGGLAAMQDWAVALGGDLDVTSGANGTTVRFVLARQSAPATS